MADSAPNDRTTAAKKTGRAEDGSHGGLRPRRGQEGPAKRTAKKAPARATRRAPVDGPDEDWREPAGTARTDPVRQRPRSSLGGWARPMEPHPPNETRDEAPAAVRRPAGEVLLPGRGRRLGAGARRDLPGHRRPLRRRAHHGRLVAGQRLAEALRGQALPARHRPRRPDGRPGLGDYFRAVGVIAANRKSVGAALAQGEDVVVWPGGEVDAMRSWSKRDVATLGGRTGFVKQAIRSGVPILPVATVGGHDTVFVLNEGKWLANALDKVLGLKKTLRGSNLPIIAGFPFPIAVEILPAHVPLPAKIRTELLDPIEVDTDPERADDDGVRAEDLRPGGGRDPGGHGPAGRQADAAGPRVSARPTHVTRRRGAGWTSTATAPTRGEALDFFDCCPRRAGGDARPVAGERAAHRLTAGRAAGGLRLVRQGVPRRRDGAPAAVHRRLGPARGRSTRPCIPSACSATDPACAALAAAAALSVVRPLLYTSEPAGAAARGGAPRGARRRRWSTTRCRSSTSSGGSPTTCRLGSMDLRGLPHPFFFLLHRERSLSAPA